MASKTFNADVSVVGALDVTQKSTTRTNLEVSGADELLLTLISPIKNHTHLVLYSSGLATQQIWNYPSGNVWKRIDSTYTGNLVSQNITSIYKDDGATLLAQLTETFTYSSGNVIGSTMVRNV